MITFYDLASKNLKSWSPNLWKTRYVLNLKNLPYKTVYLEYTELEPTFKELGIPPGEKKPDGSPWYTAPAIVDSSTGAKVANSYQIAEYLDKAYPTTPKVIPAGTEAFHAVFYEHFNQLINAAIFPVFLPKVPDLLNPISAEYFHRTRAEMFGRPLKQIEPVGEAKVQAWDKIKAAFNTVDGWLNRSSGPFLMGDTVTFADVVIASSVHSMKLCLGGDSEEWKDILTWNGGGWGRLLDSMDQYASVDK